MFFMFWFTHLPESEVSSYPPAILPVARLARMVKAVAVEDPGFSPPARWGSLIFITFLRLLILHLRLHLLTREHQSSAGTAVLNREHQSSVGTAWPQRRAPSGTRQLELPQRMPDRMSECTADRLSVGGDDSKEEIRWLARGWASMIGVFCQSFEARFEDVWRQIMRNFQSDMHRDRHTQRDTHTKNFRETNVCIRS